MEVSERFERELSLRSPSTQYHYRQNLKKFEELTGVKREQIIEMPPEDVGLLVSEAMKKDRDSGRKASTSYQIAKAVKFYMSLSGKTLKLSKKPRILYNGSRGVSKDEIRGLHDAFSRSNFSLRNKAILLTMKDSGLRISDVGNLKLGQYLEAKVITSRDDEFEVNKGEKFLVFREFETLKTKDLAHVILGPESVKALEAYIGNRKDPEEALFTSGKTGARLGTQALSELFRRVRKTKAVKFDTRKVSAHSLRKFHFSSLQHLGENLVYWLEGKASSEYFRPNESDVVRAYIGAYDSLRVFEADIKALREENKKLREEDSARYKSLEAQVEKLTAQAELNELNFQNALKMLRAVTNPDQAILKESEQSESIEQKRILWEKLKKIKE